MSTVPGFLAQLVDDAAIFPPASTPLGEAVAAHHDHRSGAYAELVGPFVVSDVRLPDLIEVVSTAQRTDRGLAVSVVVTGGAGAIEPAVRWATGSDLLDVRALETPLRDEDDLARNATRVVTAVDQVRDVLGDLPVYVEPPRPRLSGGADQLGPGWLAALDAIAAADLRLKFRTGGTDAESFPTAVELAACIDAALDRELPFKCTAGLHHATRYRDAETGFEHHGFLNVLAATQAAFDGAARDETLAVLDDRNLAVKDDRLGSARRWFTSFGCCSVVEPLADLVRLGLVTP